MESVLDIRHYTNRAFSAGLWTVGQCSRAVSEADSELRRWRKDSDLQPRQIKRRFVLGGTPNTTREDAYAPRNSTQRAQKESGAGRRR